MGEFQGREPPARDKRDAGRPTTASGRRRKRFSEEGERWEERVTETGSHRDREKRQGDIQRQRDREKREGGRTGWGGGLTRAGGAEGGFQTRSSGKTPARRGEGTGGRVGTLTPSKPTAVWLLLIPAFFHPRNRPLSSCGHPASPHRGPCPRGRWLRVLPPRETPGGGGDPGTEDAGVQNLSPKLFLTTFLK